MPQPSLYSTPPRTYPCNEMNIHYSGRPSYELCRLRCPNSKHLLVTKVMCRQLRGSALLVPRRPCWPHLLSAPASSLTSLHPRRALGDNTPKTAASIVKHANSPRCCDASHERGCMMTAAVAERLIPVAALDPSLAHGVGHLELRPLPLQSHASHVGYR